MKNKKNNDKVNQKTKEQSMDFEEAINSLRAAADELSKSETQESLRIISNASKVLTNIQSSAKAVTTQDAVKAVAIQDAAKAVAIQDAAKAVAIQDAVKAVAIQDAAKAVAIQDAAKTLIMTSLGKQTVEGNVSSEAVTHALALIKALSEYRNEE